MMAETTQSPICAVGDEIQKCLLCKKGARLSCSECGAFYCSSKCQKEDWNAHLLVCKPMPKLISIEEFEARRSLPCDVAKEAWSLEYLLQVNPEMMGKLIVEVLNMTQEKLEQMIGRLKTNADGNTVSGLPPGNKVTQKTVAPALPPAALPPPDSEVVLCAFHSPNRCYVRPICKEEDDKYRPFLDKVCELGQNAPIFKGPIATNAYVLVRQGEKYLRAKVTKPNAKPDMVRVLLIDIGSTALIPKADLREMPHDLMKLPPRVVLVNLKDVPNYSRNDRLNSVMSALQRFTYKISYDIHHSKPSVELIKEYDNNSINSILCENGCDSKLFDKDAKANSNNISKNSPDKPKENKARAPSEPCRQAQMITAPGMVNEKEDENMCTGSEADSMSCTSKCSFSTSSGDLTVKSFGHPNTTHDHQENKDLILQSRSKQKLCNGPVMECPFKKHPLDPMDEQMLVVVLDNSRLDVGYFSCMPVEHIGKLNHIQKRLSQLTDPHPYKPVLHEYCIARFEDYWYRAQVIGIKEKDDGTFLYRVEYADFCNEAVLPMEDIRRFPQGFNDDCHTVLCLINNIPQKNPAAGKLLVNRVPVSTLLTIENVERKDAKVFLCDVPTVQKELKGAGFV